MDLTKLRQINELKAVREDAQGKHDDLVLASIATQETILKSFKSLINYLENKVSRTEVVNQLREIATPDVDHVVTALDSLHNTIKEHKNTDLTEITGVMRGVLDETKKIPKDLPKAEKLELKDYTKQLTTLETTIKNVEKAIKAQKLNVEAPVVNVPETVVNVEKPDLKPIETSITSNTKDVVKAVKGIKIPELNTDPVEKLLKKTNKLLEELPDLMPRGGGGGGSAWITTNTAGTPVPIELTADGNLPVDIQDTSITIDTTGLATDTNQTTTNTKLDTVIANQLPDGHNVTVDNASIAVTGTFWQATQPVSGTVTTSTTPLTLRYDDTTSATYTYIGEATAGTATSSASWRVKRLTNADNTIVFADGNTNFDNIYDNRGSLSYS